MTNRYPLYYTLNSVFNDSPLTTPQKKKLAKDVSSSKNAEVIFMLICEYAKDKDKFEYDMSAINLPYEMNIVGNDVEVDIETLPHGLQNLLVKFLGMKQP